jgi:hypothetical protein
LALAAPAYLAQPATTADPHHLVRWLVALAVAADRWRGHQVAHFMLAVLIVQPQAEGALSRALDKLETTASHWLQIALYSAGPDSLFLALEQQTLL